MYQTLPFAPGRKSKRQAGKAFREQDHSSLSLEVAGAVSHVGSPQMSLWLLVLQTPVWFCLLVLPSYACAGCRREALLRLYRLYRNPTVEKVPVTDPNRASRLTPTFPMAVVIKGCDPFLSRKHRGYQSPTCDRGLAEKGMGS